MIIHHKKVMDNHASFLSFVKALRLSFVPAGNYLPFLGVFHFKALIFLLENLKIYGV